MKLVSELPGLREAVRSFSDDERPGSIAAAVEFVRMPIPERFFPPGVGPGEPWPSLFYGNLVHNFMQELLDGSGANQGNFAQSAKVQEVINAVALSHRERRWVDLPLPRGD